MPVITFIRDLLAAAGGPYQRTVGRHTRRFCRRAADRAANEAQRKMLLIAAVAADDYIAALLGVGDKAGPAAGAANPRGQWAANAVPDAMRTYLSALLILLGNSKDIVLANAALDERRFLALWCAAFEYRPADMERFDKRLRAGYRNSGVDGLAAAAAADIYALLYPGEPGADDNGKASLKTAVLEDTAALLRRIAKSGVNEPCS